MDLIDLNLNPESVNWEDVRKALILQSHCMTPEEFNITESVSRILKLFVNQLAKDRENMKENREVSICAKYVPRLHGSLDTKTHFVHKLATELYPPHENSLSGLWYYRD